MDGAMVQRVLIVDDEPGLGATTARLARSAGYEAVFVNTAAAALDRLNDRATQFMAVLSDVHMVGMDGVALARQIAEEFPGLPVVLCSGDSGPGIEILERQVGVTAVLGKPIRRKQLADLLSTLAKD